MSSHGGCAESSHSSGGNVHHCLNCGAPAPGRYCPACGQETAPDAPDLRALVRSRLSRHAGPESQLWQTLRLLLLKPGALTLEYARGRRVRYLRPVQLYLWISVVVFGAFQLFGLDLGLRFVGDRGLPVAKSARAVSAASADGNRLLPVQIILEYVDTPAIRRFSALPPQERFTYLRARRTQYVASFLLFVVPLFAVAIGLFYRRQGRRFMEHLVFGLHCQSLLLLVLLVEAVVPPLLANILSLWFLAYFGVALHRVYGGSWLAAVVRTPLMLGLYFGVFVVANLLLVLGLLSV